MDRIFRDTPAAAAARARRAATAFKTAPNILQRTTDTHGTPLAQRAKGAKKGRTMDTGDRLLELLQLAMKTTDGNEMEASREFERLLLGALDDAMKKARTVR
jgi:molybdenum-dependent DNA-binding transcriptional regulator ModE